MKTILRSAICILLCTAFLFGQSQSSRDDGIEFYRSGQLDKAVEALQIVTKADKKDRLAWLYLGASYLKLGKEKEAANAFQNSNFSYKDPAGNFDENLKVISKPHAKFTERARANNVSGTIKIAVEFGADSKIGFAFPFQTLPDGLTDNAVLAARSIRFKPAVKDRKSVTVVSVLTYSFSIY